MKMKKIMYLTIAALTAVACKQEPKDYVTFSGKITNQSSDSLVIGSNTDRNFQKRITVDADGAFSDTLKYVTDEKFMKINNKYLVNISTKQKLFLKSSNIINYLILCKLQIKN